MSNLSEELDNEEDVGSLGSLSNHGASDEADLEGDTWIEELECALLADFDPATLKKISEGRRVPSRLRPDYWRTLLALIDTEKVKLTSEYDLDNQATIRQDCERLVLDISENLSAEPLDEAERLRLMSDFESTLTTYVKARPELCYVSDNGWTDILKVLYHLNLSDTLLYQMFFRIVDRYIPKDLSDKPPVTQQPISDATSSKSDTLPKDKVNDKDKTNIADKLVTNSELGKNGVAMPKNASSSSIQSNFNQSTEARRSVQAYHLLRLLIQYHDPELCSILDSRKITPKMWVKDWFCSLFARSCSPKLALLIWDTHFRMADPFLIFFAAIVMVVNASDELKSSTLDQAKMLNVLKAMPGKLEEDDIEDLYDLVSNYYTNSTPRSIRCYSHLFFMDTFGNTYLGNESPEDGQPLLDLRTTQLTNSLDLSQYLCLPIVPAEIFTLDTAQFRSQSSPTLSSSTLRYFLVDCRPAEQYNAGHLTKAFHLDCSLMLREPSSFATAVQALLEIQRQVVASKSSTGGRHLCFIGSGHEDEDRYVNMVVASFLQKYQKYVSIVVGGFEAIHDYVKTKSELKDSFTSFIVDHNEELCKACYSKSPDAFENYKSKRAHSVSSGSGLSSAQSLFASTTSFLRGDKGVLSSGSGTFSKLTPGPQATATANLIAQSGASMFDNFTRVIASNSSVAKIKDRCGEILKMQAPTVVSGTNRGHVSSQDKLGKRYTGGSGGGGLRYAIDDEEDENDLNGGQLNGMGLNAINEPIQEIQIDIWQQQTKILAFYKCAQIKGNSKYPGFVALSKTI